jgi:hypothetical protein
MKPFPPYTSAFVMTCLLTALAGLAPLRSAQAQSFCASDGQPRPVQLLERFMNADCEHCWSDPATPPPSASQIALDWVVPGSKGDDAPLSAVASRDALARLETLGESRPEEVKTNLHSVKEFRGTTLRVSHGLPLNDYLGTSIELRPIPVQAKRQRLNAWLALVETLPAGTEGSPVERNLVRNVIQTSWGVRNQRLKTDQSRFFEARSMSIPSGTDPNRLRVIGWVEDERGHILAAAQSRCKPT